MSNSKEVKQSKKPHSKAVLAIFSVVIVALIAGIGVILYLAYRDPDFIHLIHPDFPEERPDPIYSNLSGLEISDANLNTSPTFCVQIPNGSSDGARPQAGLNDAAIVFEAIAETGITRLAAIFQNPNVSVIGPIRSLRPYYLDWDTPFDCTVVHAGGSNEALSAIAWGGQRNLDEDYAYMWREQNTDRLWNNLFTSPTKLLEFNANHDYNASHPQTFPRLTPQQTQDQLTQNQICLESSACELMSANHINVSFSQSYPHNSSYNYDAARNVYLRSHQDGEPHLTYQCLNSLQNPNTKTDCGDPVQVAPSALAIMRVQESTMADNYHEAIDTIGSGEAVIFQNGEVILGTWSKSSQDSQIVFRDANGDLIKFTPGQLWVSAVPQFGSVSWE